MKGKNDVVKVKIATCSGTSMKQGQSTRIKSYAEGVLDPLYLNLAGEKELSRLCSMVPDDIANKFFYDMVKRAHQQTCSTKKHFKCTKRDVWCKCNIPASYISALKSKKFLKN